MNRIEFHPEAEREVLEAYAWYEQRSEVAAQAFALELDATLNRILESPLRWLQTSPGERRLALERFPYWVIYRIRGETIFVTAVAHQKRRPKYWRSRS